MKPAEKAKIKDRDVIFALVYRVDTRERNLFFKLVSDNLDLSQ